MTNKKDIVGIYIDNQTSEDMLKNMGKGEDTENIKKIYKAVDSMKENIEKRIKK